MSRASQPYLPKKNAISTLHWVSSWALYLAQNGRTSLGLLAQLVSHQRYQGSKSELYTINVTHEASGANWEAICVIRWGFDRSTSRCPIAIKNFTTCTNLSQKREQTYKYPERQLRPLLHVSCYWCRGSLVVLSIHEFKERCATSPCFTTNHDSTCFIRAQPTGSWRREWRVWICYSRLMPYLCTLLYICSLLSCVLIFIECAWCHDPRTYHHMISSRQHEHCRPEDCP